MALQPPLGAMTAAARDRVEAALIEIIQFDTDRAFIAVARQRYLALTVDQRQYTDAELLRGIETARSPVQSIAAE